MREQTKTGLAPTWQDEDDYWRSHYASRPYAEGERYDTYQPGYRYGYEAAAKYDGRDWQDVEGDLEREWDRFAHKGSSTWQQMKHAVRDAWARITGR